MNTKTLSNRALSTIDQYEHFKVESAVCSIPYYNNRTKKARASLRTIIGKGSPKDIYEEIQSIIIKNHVDKKLISDESLKQILVDNNIGIDCSGLAYYILNSECEELNKGQLDRNIHFTKCRGILGKIRCALRPVENCDVATFADEKNSQKILTKEAVPGNIITMTGDDVDSERDHILVVYQVEYQNFVPTKIHYVHAVAYPTDGIYGTGIKKGLIEITNPEGDINGQRWIENNLTNEDSLIFKKVKRSKTELRKLLFL